MKKNVIVSLADANYFPLLEELIESIKRFPDQNQLSSVIRSAEFKLVKHRNLSGGIAAIHSGWKI